MPVDTPDWFASAQDAVRRAPLGPRPEHRGRVEEIGDGVAMISGLRDVRLDEVLRFEGGQIGFARVLDPDLIGCVFVDAATNVEAGDAVFGTGEVVSVPVGEALLGRIVDPLGRPLDGKGAIEAEERWPIERPAPSIIERDLVTQPVQTGILVMDTLFALGRGQRELIVGDHSTGKTTLATDAMIAQAHSDMICVYVAVGQKTSSVRRAIDALQAHGNFARCIVIVAGSASPNPIPSPLLTVVGRSQCTRLWAMKRSGVIHGARGEDVRRKADFGQPHHREDKRSTLLTPISAARVYPRHTGSCHPARQ